MLQELDSVFSTGRALTREEIAVHPKFPAIERQIADHLIAIHDRTPRLSRLKASHRKWLMTHSLYALSLQRVESDPLSGLTATRFIEIVMQLGAASRNTAAAFLAELVAYKFLRDVPGVTDRRVRVLETTEISNQAMIGWFMGHMACLDQLDGGRRLAVCTADPRLFRIAQPIAAATLVADPEWRNPPDSIGHFLNSDMGGMVLHDLISRLDAAPAQAGRVSIGPVALSVIGERYLVSATNLKRMFKRAETEGLLGWTLPRRRGDLWLSDTFISDYFRWQSAKFAALDEAYCIAAAELAMGDGAAQPAAPGEEVDDLPASNLGRLSTIS
ncbi:hypothetical protein [Agrobacterium sp. a22-2]|uniref:hypothetical protein n=1 Tax=Agrobacterium sp. a22-2 TaxID=2283840 RepID=UPI001FF00FD9|nr:hypothetical protein [Agrobacterium sp. a22-2]